MTLKDLPYHQYPNPRFRRKDFVLLNGQWDFAFTDEFKKVNDFDMKINVPYPYECKESGIGDEKEHECMLYRTFFDVDALDHYILHFKGVDYMCNVFVNGDPVYSHTGCYSSFSIHLFNELKLKHNELVLVIHDSFNKSQLRGKQRTREENYECWYNQYSGIIKDVYLERCGNHPILYAKCSGDKNGLFKYEVELDSPANVKVIVSRLGKEVKTLELTGNLKHYVGEYHFNDVDLYSDESPNLYDVRFISSGSIEDIVDTYFGFRTIETKNQRIYINDKETYLRMILDQGYYPNKLITGTKEEMLNDLLFVKEVGFNGVRVHQKSESDFFYYIADYLGIYLWDEIPSAYEFTPKMQEEYRREIPRILLQNYNSPSIIVNLLFNECWSVYQIKDDIPTQNFVHEMNELARRCDDTRLVISNDGWYQLSDTDIVSLHEYEQDASKLYEGYKDQDYVLTGGKVINTFGPAMANYHKYNNQPVILSEFGGGSIASSSGWGYGEKLNGIEAYKKQLKDIFKAVQSLTYLSGYCYTQLCDVSQETNGLLDENRNMKLSIDEYREIIIGGNK